MINYYSQTCDVCGKQFVEGDDIVVCPDCGTPHHRECWFSTGHCVNEEKHAQGFEWKPVQILGVNTAAVKCPKCGYPIQAYLRNQKKISKAENSFYNYLRTAFSAIQDKVTTAVQYIGNHTKITKKQIYTY